MKKLIIVVVLLGILLGFPSIIYLFQNKTIDGYNGQNYYFIGNDNIVFTILGAIVLAIVLIGSFIVYLKLIKNSDKFLNVKSLLFTVFLVSLIFLICLPNTSTDVFYYMGTGRVLSEYNQNPYYHTVKEVLETNPNDTILKNSGIWSDSVVVYGPLWVVITFLLNKLSFGSINILLYLFKFSNLFIHLLNCLIIYKLTKKKKFVVIYGFNPLILLEFLVNVHNDIYMIFFVLLALYFLKNKNNLILSLIMLMCSVLIKHLTILLVPIFILYKFQNQKWFKRIYFLVLYGIAVFFILLGIYLLFFKNVFCIFDILLNQQEKLKDSVYLLIDSFFGIDASRIIYSIAIVAWVYLYIHIFTKLLLLKNTFRDTMKSIYILYLTFIFGILTNLTSWYLAWLFIPFAYIKANDIKNILWLGFFYELTYIYFAFWHSDSYILGIIVIPTIILGMSIVHFVNFYRKKKFLTV